MEKLQETLEGTFPSLKNTSLAKQIIYFSGSLRIKKILLRIKKKGRAFLTDARNKNKLGQHHLATINFFFFDYSSINLLRQLNPPPPL
jgi:hypothetical protein